jgi:enoyl-CoA hydratase
VSFVRVEDRDGIALVTLDRPPANAISSDVIAQLSELLRQKADSSGVVIASSLPTIFSAGWDLPYVLELDRPAMEAFVERFCDLVRQIFTFSPPVIAALPGHAIAGGLIVAAGADERWAGEGQGRVGLSEVLLGVPVPECCLELFRHVIGFRAAERLASTGENVSLAAASSMGLVDRVVAPGDLVGLAIERARELAKLPVSAYSAIKHRARAAALARFDQARRGDPFLDFWFRREARDRIRALVEKLRKKS